MILLERLFKFKCEKRVDFVICLSFLSVQIEL
jgi:hypothetical protein